MKKFIWRHFVKDYENHTDPEVRARYTKLTGVLGIIVNSILCVIKIILGSIIGSIAVIGDGLHDMADSLAAGITLLGMHISRKPADEQHPFGHARAEYLAGLAVSVVILIVGVELFKSSLDKCVHPVETGFSWLMVCFMLFAILLKGSSSLFTIATGKHIGSLPVIAAGTDNRNDVITSIVIVCGMLLHHFCGLDLDGYMGCLVALFILWSGISLIRETIHPLLGEPPDSRIVDKMKEIISRYPEILDVHDIMVYNYGPGKNFASFHAEVDARSDMLGIHEVIDRLEREISAALNLYVTCHMDPVIVNDPVRSEMSRAVSRAIAPFEDDISGFHDLRVASGKGRPLVYLDLVIRPGKDVNREEITEAVCGAVRTVREDAAAVISFDRIEL